MKKILFFLLFLPCVGSAQPALTFAQAVTRQSPISASPIQPEPGSTVNRTQIMFEHPKVAGAALYHVQVFELKKEGKKTDTVFVREQPDSSTATLISRLEFGRDYAWQYKAYDANKNLLQRSPYYSFSTGNFPSADPEKFRARVTRNASRGNTGIITFDYAHAAVDRMGKPVWCLPPVPVKVSESELVRDLRINRAGTVTFLTTKNAIEMSIDGRIIWQAPNDGKLSGDTVEYYHHDLRRMPNGNYMTLSSKYVKRTMPGDTAQVKVEYGVIAEYDFLGRVIWSWCADTYLQDKDLFRRDENGKWQYVAPHMNAFDVDENEEFIYAGFRDLYRVIRIEKKTGRVTASYGTRLGTHTTMQAHGFFRKQHDANVLPDGSIVVFNNDSTADPNITSSVVVFSQPKEPNEFSRIMWKFDCKFDTLSDGKSIKAGGVELLPNGNFLVNMGTLNRTIEVSREKKIMWDVFTESWNEKEQRWTPFGQYRSHYSSSLYPCYFTSSLSAESWSKDTRSLWAEIVNEGTEEDAYTVEYKIRGKADPVIVNVNALPPNGKISLEIKPQTIPARGQVLEVKVRSKNNTGFVRSYRVPYK